MKRIYITIAIIGCTMFWNLQAQRVVWQDDFETSKGWSEYEDEDGEAVVKDGVLNIKAKEGWVFRSKCKTSLDGSKNFTITVDVKIKTTLERGCSIGIAFDYYDTKNYKAFYIDKGFAKFEEYRNGVMVRDEKEPLKKNFKYKKGTVVPFEIQKNGQNALFIVNGEETIDMDEIAVKSNRISFFVTNGQEASFDNVKISQ